MAAKYKHLNDISGTIGRSVVNREIKFLSFVHRNDTGMHMILVKILDVTHLNYAGNILGNSRGRMNASPINNFFVTSKSKIAGSIIRQ